MPRAIEGIAIGEISSWRIFSNNPPQPVNHWEDRQEIEIMSLTTEQNTTTPVQDSPRENLDHARIAQDLQMRKAQVDAAVTQLNSGWNPVFLARYRSELAGGLNEPALRAIASKLKQGRLLGERRNTILRAIESQGALTEELRVNLNAADSLRRLEDLFLPFKPKRRGPASQAKDRGLGVFAEAVWAGDSAVGNLLETATKLIDPARGFDTADRVLEGVSSILADMLADQADLRSSVRVVLNESGNLKAAKNPRTSDANAQEYREFFRFSEPLRQVTPHKIFSIRRGEKSNALEVLIDWNRPSAVRLVIDRLPLPEAGQSTGFAEFLANWKPLPKPAPVEVAPTPASSEEPSQEVETSVSTETPVDTLSAESVAAVTVENETTAINTETGATTPADESTETEPADASSVTPEAAPSVTPPESKREITRSSAVDDPYFHIPAPKFKFGPPSPEVLSKHPYRAFLERVAERVIHEFMGPSLERETRRELGTKADEYAIGICCRTLRMRLLTPPSPGLRLLAIDPAARGGCKVAILDENGDLVEEGSFNAHPPQSRKAEPKHKLEEWIRKHQIEVVVIGNGAGFRHVETVVAELLQEFDDRRNGRAKIEDAPPEVNPESTTGEDAPAESQVNETTGTLEAPSVASLTTESQPEGVATEAPVSETRAETEVGESADNPENSEAVAESPTEASSSSDEKTEEGLTFAPGARTNKHGGRKERKSAPFVPVSLDHLPAPLESLAFTTIAEVGAAAYGGSALGREELPNHEAPLRAAISIGRRFIDSLAEMVKVDPQYLVSGVHATEAQGKNLREALEGVLESAVAQVGLDPNKASVAALKYIPGLNSAVARDLVEYRKNIGKFTNRHQLRLVPGMTEDRYVQSVGFLRIADGDSPLDSTWIHPEQYPVADWILSELKTEANALRNSVAHRNLRQKIETEGPGIEAKAPSSVPNVSNAVIRQILGELIHGGDDVRMNFPSPLLRHGVLSMESLEVGQEVRGTVLNVVDFGCFVDVGLKDGGLVHISEMANRFVRSPHELVHVGEVVRVWIRAVDKEKGRVSLTMIRPGSDRAQAGGGQRGPQNRGRRPGGPRPEGTGERPDQGGRPPRREGGRHEQGGRPGGERQGGGDRGPARGRGPGGPQGRDVRGPSKALPRGLADLPPRGTSLKQQMGKGKPKPKDGGTDQASQTTGSPEADKGIVSQQAPKTKREPQKPQIVNPEALKTGSNLGTFAELAAFWNVAKTDSDKGSEQTPSES